jgi:hypothetical protein
VLETAEGSPPDRPFPSRPGVVFPLYHVFADLAEWPAGELLECRSADTLAVDGLAVRAPDGLHVLLANMTPAEQRVTLGPLAGGRVTLRRLDEHSAAEALFEPERFRAQREEAEVTGDALTLTLAPYAVTRIDVPA